MKASKEDRLACRLNIIQILRKVWSLHEAPELDRKIVALSCSRHIGNDASGHLDVYRSNSDNIDRCVCCQPRSVKANCLIKKNPVKSSADEVSQSRKKQTNSTSTNELLNITKPS